MNKVIQMLNELIDCVLTKDDVKRIIEEMMEIERKRKRDA